MARSTGDRPEHPARTHARIERRRFLRDAGLATGAVALGGLGVPLAGCGGSKPADPAASPGAAAPGSSAPAATLDPSLPYWLQGNFAPVTEELDVVDLEIEGSVPPELSGLYVRNGSNPRGEPSSHWFLGDGMLHGIRLEGGRAAWYRNRWVQTPLLAAGTGLMGAGVPGGANNQSNVSVFAHAGRLLTSGEIGLPYEIDPDTLATVGPYDYGGRLTSAMTAHPKVHPETGRLHFFGYGFVPPYLVYHEVDADGTLARSEEIAVAGPTMMHDFAITEQEAVFWELPVVFSLQAAMDGSGMPFQWQPDYGARIGILPFDQPAASIRWVEIDPCYVFHGINAHREGDDVIVEVCRQATMFSSGGDLEPSAVHRWRIGTGGEQLTFAEDVMTDLSMDLPTIDRRRTGRQQRHSWLVETTDTGGAAFDFTGICHWDHQRGAADRWLPADERPNEVTLAATGPGEGEGWLLSWSYDPARDASHLAVLDPMDLASGPVARVRLPVRVPYGFHGTWVPDDAV